MSGVFGWSNNSESKTRAYNPGAYDYSSANSAHSAPKVNVTNIPDPTQIVKQTIPGSTHGLKSSAKNLLIVSLDLTSSMKDWPGEIFKRLPMLFNEVSQYLGQSLEILFCAHGDAEFDKYPVQISKFAAGPELDDILNSFYTKCWGGTNEHESHELVAYYLLNQIDISSANNVFTFFLTDEPPCSLVSEQFVESILALDFNQEYRNTTKLFHVLQNKMRVFTIACDTKTWNTKHVQDTWEKHVGKNNVIPLDDYRRTVDVILGTVAKLTNNFNTFTQNLQKRQGNNPYAVQNITKVNQSIAFVGQSLTI